MSFCSLEEAAKLMNKKPRTWLGLLCGYVFGKSQELQALARVSQADIDRGIHELSTQEKHLTPNKRPFCGGKLQYH
eukprot:912629-Amphidinium_carterae.1